ncbi:MAG: NifB/NifX family molybdenum-iron cluster-binding protein [candidate division KSB1 bacterium]|nr:NifB/NifX family molybdenum-iron cluster-binding protein [candidate division KSB1 bacterium]
MIDPRFGRAKYFMIFDSESGDITFLDNEQNLQSPSGAGIQSAQTIVNAGVDSLLTGHCGPKAFRALNAAGVSVYTHVQGDVTDAIEAFQTGKLQKADQADVEGHW